MKTWLKEVRRKAYVPSPCLNSSNAHISNAMNYHKFSLLVIMHNIGWQ